MKLFDPTLDALSRAMDARLLRHSVLAGNLANANTPGYQPRDIDFGKALEAAEQSPAAMAAPSVPAHEGFIPVAAAPAPAVAALAPTGATGVTGATAGATLDGNKVDADRTMVELATNALQYGAAAKAAGKKLALLRYVASDGAA
jgi:flagellar basal-body rod protein FlgB